MNTNYDSLKANIVNSWNGGYKLEIDYSTAELTSDTKGWSLFVDNLNGNIREIYGMDVVKTNGGKTEISPVEYFQKNNVENTAVLIVDGDVPSGEIQLESSAMNKDLNRNSLMGEAVSDSSSVDNLTEYLNDSSYVLETADFDNQKLGSSYNYNSQELDWDVNWSNQMNKYSSISDLKQDGDLELKIDYPDDRQTNTGASWEIPERNEYYLSYSLKFEPGFDFNGDEFSGGKLPGLGTDELASGGEKANGSNGFTSRPMWREDGKAALYLYHMDQPKTYGEDFDFKGSDGDDRYFQPGKWHNLIQRIEINDGKQHNGEIDFWLDGEQVVDLDGLQFVGNGSGINKVYFSSFFGGNDSGWLPDSEQSAYFDDFVVTEDAADVGL